MSSDELSKSNSPSVKLKALSLLARREHSVLELRSKLMSQGFDSDLIENVVQQLIESGMQSDNRFAESYSRSRAARGFGPLRILMELRDKGVSADVIEEHVDKHSEQWQRLAEQQLEKKFSRISAKDLKDLASMKRFLHYRGFDSHWVTLLNKSQL